MRASCDAVVGLAFGIARHLPELEADMRLAEGGIFHRMRMPGRSRAGYEKAEPLCRELALKRPESAQAHARLGLALAGLGRHGEALASCDRAALLDPGRAATHLGRAMPLARLDRHGDALAGCRMAAELDPSIPDARRHVARARLGGSLVHTKGLPGAAGPHLWVAHLKACQGVAGVDPQRPGVARFGLAVAAEASKGVPPARLHPLLLAPRGAGTPAQIDDPLVPPARGRPASRLRHDVPLDEERHHVQRERREDGVHQALDDGERPGLVKLYNAHRVRERVPLPEQVRSSSPYSSTNLRRAGMPRSTAILLTAASL